MSHSPLPWVAGLDIPVAANNMPDKRLVWSGSLLIADCRSVWLSTERAILNARLMAAAPELLAFAQRYLDSEATTAECDAMAKAAIAKATKEAA